MITSFTSTQFIGIPLKIDILKDYGNIERVRNIIDPTLPKQSIGEKFAFLSDISNYTLENIDLSNNSEDAINKLSHNIALCLSSTEGLKQTKLIDFSNLDLEDFVDVTQDSKYVKCDIVGFVGEETQSLSDNKRIIVNDEVKDSESSSNLSEILIQEQNLNTGSLELYSTSISMEDSDSAIFSHMKPSSDSETILSNPSGSNPIVTQSDEGICSYLPVQADVEGAQAKDVVYCKQLSNETYDLIKMSTGSHLLDLLDCVDDNPNCTHILQVSLDEQLLKNSIILISDHLVGSINAIFMQSSGCDLYAAGGIGKIMMSLLAIQMLFLMISLQCVSYYFNKDICKGNQPIVLSDGSNLLSEALKLKREDIKAWNKSINYSALFFSFIDLVERFDRDLFNSSSKAALYLEKLFVNNINNGIIKNLIMNCLQNPHKSHMKIRSAIMKAIARLS